MKKSPRLAAFALAFFAFLGCEKGFEDLNENPYSPTETSIEALFNGLCSTLQLGWAEQFYVHNEKLYPASQLAALTTEAWSNTAIGIDEIWASYYKDLKNARQIEAKMAEFVAAGGSDDELRNVRAQLATLMAYKTFRVTDLFGAMPFSEGGRGAENVDFLRPKFDAQEAIYKKLLDDLARAAADIEPDPTKKAANGQPFYSLGKFDALFDGDLKKWQRFAHSLRLRHAMRMVEKDRAFAEPIVRDILENDWPLVRKGEEVILSPKKLGFAKLSTHWSFREHKNLRMGTTVWRLLSPDPAADGSGIIDPRAQLFFETNNAGAWAAYPNAPPSPAPTEGGSPYGPQRDFNFDQKGASCAFSPLHFFLVRDETDVPEVLFTAAECHFLKAEALLRGIGTAENKFEAEAEFADGIAASIGFWAAVAEKTAIWDPKPSIGQAEIFGYAFHPKVSLSANGFAVEKVWEQAWLDHFRQPWEAFSLARRTGRTPREGAALAFFRLPYPASEANYNAENWQKAVAELGGQDRSDAKIWWMP